MESYNEWMDRPFEEVEELREKQEREREFNELSNLLDAQIYLAEVLDEGYSIVQEYEWDSVKKDFDKNKKVFVFVTADEKFKAKNKDFKNGFWDFYCQVIEWELEQEEEREREEKENDERFFKMDETDFYFG